MGGIYELTYETPSLDVFFSESTMLYLIESGEGVQEGVFAKLRQKIEKMIDSAKEWFRNFHTKKVVNGVDATMEERFEENPELKEQKVEIRDDSELVALQQKTLDELERVRTEPELKMKMQKYKKQRNKILAATAVITVTLSAAVVFLHKKSQSTITQLDRQNKKLKAQVQDYEDELGAVNKKLTNVKKAAVKKIRELKDENESLKARTPAEKVRVKGKQTVRKVKTGSRELMEPVNSRVNLARGKTQAMTDVVKDTIEDTKSNITDLATTILNPKTSGVKKVGAIAKSVGSQAEILGSVKGAVKDSGSNHKEAAAAFIKKWRVPYQKYVQKAKDTSLSRADREKAARNARRLKDILDRVKAGGPIPDMRQYVKSPNR